MNTAVENDIRKLHVIGTAGVTARLGRRGTDAPQGPSPRLVLAAPRTYRIRGELIKLPHVTGVSTRVLWSTVTVRPERVTPAA